MTQPPSQPTSRPPSGRPPATRPPSTRPSSTRPSSTTAGTPLYLRRPFLAGVLRQLPLLSVLAGVGAGLLLVTLEHWRRGLVVMGLALIGGAVLRLALPLRRAGFLAVRSRLVDVLLLGGAGLVLVVVALAIPAL
jgi:hypothetical protein